MSPTKVSSASILDTIELPEEFQLHKYWSVLKRRFLVIAAVSGSIFGLTAYFTLQELPTYQAGGKLLFRPDGTENLVGIKNDSGILQALTQKSDPLSTQAEIIQSESIAQSAIKALNLKDESGKPLDHRLVTAGLAVRPVIGTDILQVTYTSTDPTTAAAVVNEVMKAYIAKNIESSRKDAISARKFILDQIPATEQAVNQAEANLRQFKEANGIVALDQEATASVQGISTLDLQISQAQAELQQADAKVAQLRSQVGMDTSTALTISNLNQSQGVQKALSDWHQAKAALAKQETLYRGSHPSVTQLQRQEQAARGLVEERVAEVLGRAVSVPTGELQVGATKQALVVELAKAEVERSSLAQRLDALGRSQSAFINRSSSLPALEKTQRELQRQLDAAQTTYKGLLTRLQEAQIAANRRVGNAEIVSKAEIPITPIGPKVLLNLVAGGVIGVVLGIVIAFLLDYCDRSVRTMREARDLFQYSLLGVIPTIGSPSRSEPGVPKLVTRDSSSFAAQEAYQMLQANLRFLTSESLKSIVVTSSVGAEGKSTVAANLASAMAQVKQRVLLVDANLRTPCQHHVWELTNLVGLSNVIVGQVSFEQAVQEITQYLHVLPAGIIPPNPVTLLDSVQMSEFVQRLTADYDMVIFDSPSLSGTVDSTVLNKMTDGTLLVVRPGTINAATGNAAKEYLAQSGQKVLGMVINHFDIRKEPDSYFYYNKQELDRQTTEQSRANVS